MTIHQNLVKAAQALKLAGVETARLDALVLLELTAKKNRSWLLAHPEATLNSTAIQRYNSLINKRTQHMPLAYLTNKQEFYGLDFKVTPSVLIPRPETEAIVEGVLQAKAINISLLDVGTGCGAIAVVVAKHRPSWQVTASDISVKALKVASFNANAHKVKVKFVQSNLLQSTTLQAKRFDIVTANLPYVPNNPDLVSKEALYEPKLALFANHNGLALYKKFFAKIPLYSKPNGLLFIEADPTQHQQLIGLAKTYGINHQHTTGFGLTFRLL